MPEEELLPETPEMLRLKRRRNQVRDALQRCNDIVKIEQLAAILRV
jgi:hypothetical protein